MSVQQNDLESISGQDFGTSVKKWNKNCSALSKYSDNLVGSEHILYYINYNVVQYKKLSEENAR